MRNLKYVFLIVFGLLNLSCESGNLFQPSNNSILSTEKGFSSVNIDDFSKDAKYLISFDKEVWTHQMDVPELLQHSLEASKGMYSGILKDYERTRELVAISFDGDLTIVSEWLDFGGYDNTMPADMYKKYGHIMPARDASYDPVVRSVFAGGTLTYYSKSGKIVSQAQYDPSAFRVSQPELLDLVNTKKEVPTVNEMLNNFTSKGISAEYIGNSFIKIEQPVYNDMEFNKHISYLNTKSGQVERMLSLNTEGRIVMESITRHGALNGLILPQMNQTAYFGEIDGRWQETHRIVENRSYHHVIAN
jgi:hypothetical protein